MSEYKRDVFLVQHHQLKGPPRDTILTTKEAKETGKQIPNFVFDYVLGSSKRVKTAPYT